MSGIGKWLGLNKAVGGRVRRRPLKLPEGSFRVPLQMMHKPELDSDYMRDLRVPGRDRAGSRDHT